MYKMVVTVVKEGDAELGKMKCYMECCFANPVDAVKFYQQLGSQPQVVHIDISVTTSEGGTTTYGKRTTTTHTGTHTETDTRTHTETDTRNYIETATN